MYDRQEKYCCIFDGDKGGVPASFPLLLFFLFLRIGVLHGYSYVSPVLA
jgi:hypothetical protein